MIPYDGLPPGMQVFERDWLSSNNILFRDEHHATLVDSGYCTHADQTLKLIEQSLGRQLLDGLVNTHLHSDHCGGNAALQRHFPLLRTHIPSGHAEQVRQWDADALTYTATAQQCPRFAFTDVLNPGQELVLGDSLWQVHCAPGHDPNAIMLFEPVQRILISGDALWEHGFGVVFPELEGMAAFDEVSSTLDLIESLQPRVVIPGHGRVFTQVESSIDWARGRLEGFARNPKKHARYAAKVLLKFKLLESQKISGHTLTKWIRVAPYLDLIRQGHFPELTPEQWQIDLIQDLVRSGAAVWQGDQLCNA